MLHKLHAGLQRGFPLRRRTSYVDPNARPFFDNLLQERDEPLQRVMDREGLARSDVAGLLFHLGRDCPGSISVLPLGAPAAKVPGNLAWQRLAAWLVNSGRHRSKQGVVAEFPNYASFPRAGLVTAVTPHPGCGAGCAFYSSATSMAPERR
ncbi:HipA N-terminal domain-containing protein [Ensifer sp. ENS05]|uniref:HipA N-terminal domain-containing protein n=1 Tax=Ensifer sp. ENS05 TaxID=2769277 RepID=UPI00177ED967|nr:HipA N-terminal domain-containing protein [Ensifer sp. ENS05]MBD9596339.1 HipA N-terminal domain-containing protein [Ensifer sp. ENS05]